MKDRKKLFIFALCGAFAALPLGMLTCLLRLLTKQRPIIMDKPAPPLTFGKALSITCEVWTKIEVVLPAVMLGTIISLVIGLVHILEKRKKEKKLHNQENISLTPPPVS